VFDSLYVLSQPANLQTPIRTTKNHLFSLKFYRQHQTLHIYRLKILALRRIQMTIISAEPKYITINAESVFKGGHKKSFAQFFQKSDRKERKIMPPNWYTARAHRREWKERETLCQSRKSPKLIPF
jgi:hypothetical protein